MTLTDSWLRLLNKMKNIKLVDVIRNKKGTDLRAVIRGVNGRQRRYTTGVNVEGTELEVQQIVFDEKNEHWGDKPVKYITLKTPDGEKFELGKGAINHFWTPTAEKLLI